MSEIVTEETVEPEPGAPSPEQLIDDDVLIEDISIDGMCGVY